MEECVVQKLKLPKKCQICSPNPIFLNENILRKINSVQKNYHENPKLSIFIPLHFSISKFFIYSFKHGHFQANIILIFYALVLIYKQVMPKTILETTLAFQSTVGCPSCRVVPFFPLSLGIPSTYSKQFINCVYYLTQLSSKKNQYDCPTFIPQTNFNLWFLLTFFGLS